MSGPYSAPNMSITLSITTEVVQDHVLITATVTNTTGISDKIFLYLNTGTTSLGAYQGVCDLDELTRLQVYSSSIPVPIFGNKYLRHSQAKIQAPLNADAARISSTLESSVAALSASYVRQSPSTKIVVL